MLRERWQGCVLILVLLLLSNASGTSLGENTILPSNSKQTRQARVCDGADHRLLRSLANTGEEVMVTIPNSHLQHIAEFREEARLWVATNVAPFLPATMITHVLAGDDALSSVSPGDTAYSLVPAMRNIHAALVAAGLDGRIKVSTTLSAVPLAPSWSAGIPGRVLRFLGETGSPLFLLKARVSEAAVDDARVSDVYAAMLALGFSGIPVITAQSEELGGALVYHSYLYGRRPMTAGGGGRRSLATGTFCVALQNADPTALQAGLSWACGQGQADCSAVQPGGACYKQNNVAALASYAYNDYYQKSASTGATCSFNGTATTTATDPSSGSCVFAGSTMAGDSTSNSSVPSASAPTSLGAPPSDDLTPPVGSSPPSDFGPPAADTAPPTSFDAPPGGFGPPSSFGPPSVFGSPPSTFGPPGSLSGSGSFGPSGTLEPYGIGCRHVASLAASTLLSAIVLAVLCASPDLM
ncbi:glucan endo-1,3-beta-glucosidase 12-like [Triticum dicoccoides]|uniref:glucan endo-1,3-beta-glucosidase 12-like n=1 Tax=Triticum dicoccoides TaxID=85692 RepID=UPI001891CA36|nr:glucan endo-1,3-beta-glucosidase 12-like [Triticum dicoccoides]